MRSYTFQKGSALIACMVVLVVCSALAVGLAAISGANMEIAANQREANRAFASAESGLETIRYWLSRVTMPSSTPEAQYFTTAVNAVRSDLLASGITNITLNSDGTIPSVTLDAASGQSFTGLLHCDPCAPHIFEVTVRGASGEMTRTIKVDFSIEPYKFPIFDYGLATKGSLNFPQNPTLTGAAESWEADLYVESLSDILAVQVGGNANFDGNIDIANPLGTVDFQGDVQISGDHGQTAIDNHVNVGADPVEFPVPETSPFQSYATGGNINPATLTAPGTTLVNQVIPAGMNPTFTGSVTIQGILFIEQPNVVTFGKNVDLQGLIVADGSAAGPGTNTISFEGNFASGPYPADSQFDAIRQEQGSSIIAPGFGLSFTGNFASVNGVMAAGSMYFSANASAVVKGTMISYSQDPTVVNGNISMDFDRTAAVKIPAGFDLMRVLQYEPSSYAMIF